VIHRVTAVIALLVVVVLAGVAVSRQPIAMSSTDRSTAAQEESSHPRLHTVSTSLEAARSHHKSNPLAVRAGGQRLVARTSQDGDAVAASSAVESLRGPSGYKNASAVRARSGPTHASLQVMRC
jgi:osmotically-inducible protein OsmY